MKPDSWLGVEIRHFAALQALAAEGSFGRAARRLGYTQSAISQQIATLERIVGERLVERPGGPRPVTLTEAGELLLRHADSIVARLQAAQADLHALQAGEVGTLRVGTFQSVGARVLPEIMRRFTAQWPPIDVMLEELEDEEIALEVERSSASARRARRSRSRPRFARRASNPISRSARTTTARCRGSSRQESRSRSCPRSPSTRPIHASPCWSSARRSHLA